MLSKLVNFKKKENISTGLILAQEWTRFESNLQHDWIFKDKVLIRHFREFYSRLPKWALIKMKSDKPICFLRANGMFACTLSSIEKTHTVIMFPELLRILKSASPERGLAILAHELGHIMHNHFMKDINPIEAQIEADSMAYDMNFSSELMDFLEEQNRTSEIKMRIYKLTERMSPFS